MPIPAFETQPPRIPDAVALPRSYAEAHTMLGDRIHLKIADETYLVRAPRVDTSNAIAIVWYGIEVIVYDPINGWLQFNTNNYPHYRAVLDIFQRVLRDSALSVTTANDNFPAFSGGLWRINVHSLNEDRVPTPAILRNVPYSDFIHVHPAVGAIRTLDQIRADIAAA